ncbi:DUF5666 domain-containing protein [Nonomuraea sp. NPDC050310]|uniref:DUF5666 domain-containing protein n=1 Tax=Nonomuraea sp. NPDC050310 TaxID=3154935 RepID=UPI00340EBBB9
MSSKFVTALTVGAVAGALFATPAMAGTASIMSPSPSPTDMAPSEGATDMSPSPSPTDTGTDTSTGQPGALNEVGALYSETTIRGTEGKTVKVGTQWGKVDSVSDTSLTVESADGTSWTWVVNDETQVGMGDQNLDAIKSGDQVAVAGVVKEGEDRTASFIGDPVATLDNLVKEVKDAQ